LPWRRDAVCTASASGARLPGFESRQVIRTLGKHGSVVVYNMYLHIYQMHCLCVWRKGGMKAFATKNIFKNIVSGVHFVNLHFCSAAVLWNEKKNICSSLCFQLCSVLFLLSYASINLVISIDTFCKKLLISIDTFSQKVADRLIKFFAKSFIEYQHQSGDFNWHFSLKKLLFG
jgi:hypothetical protein